jgi:cytochrome P450
MAPASVFDQILEYSNRANPYPLYAELRKTPVARADDGSYVVSTYREIVALLRDPRVSSDPRNRAAPRWAVTWASWLTRVVTTPATTCCRGWSTTTALTAGSRREN